MNIIVTIIIFIIIVRAMYDVYIYFIPCMFDVIMNCMGNL